MKTSSILSQQRMRDWAHNARFQPIRGVTPERLVQYLEAFEVGELREVSLLWESIEKRDDMVQSVAPKRKRAASQLQWEIIKMEDSAAADRHREALLDAYNNLRASHCVQRHARGQVRMLVKQMMNAIGYGHAVHELVWHPVRRNGTLTYDIEAIYIPQYFFEARTGSLRYCETEFQQDGIELEKNGWLITYAETPLHIATSVAWMYKRIPIQDWLGWSDKFGKPWTHGATAAAFNSPEWDDFAEQVANLGNDCALITDLAAKVNLISGNPGQSPHEKLVDRMDRMIASLWRGGDLSTQSRDDGTGSNPQAEEAAAIEIDDAAMVSEALNEYIDKPFCRQVFGEEPLAYFRLMPTARTDAAKELQKWKDAVSLGIPLRKSDFAEEFGLPIADEDDEDLLGLPQQQEPGKAHASHLPEDDEDLDEDFEDDLDSAANAADAQERLLTETLRQLEVAEEAVRDPLLTEMEKAMAQSDHGAALRDFIEGLPGRLPSLAQDPETVRILRESGIAAFGNGLDDDDDDEDAENSQPWWRRFWDFINRKDYSYLRHHPKSGRFVGRSGTSASKKINRDIRTAKKAMDQGLREKRDITHVLHRPKLGWIDFPYGYMGLPAKDYKHGWGLTHIEAKHRKMMHMVPTILARGKIGPKPEPYKGGGRKYYIRHDGYLLVVVKPKKGNAWLLTAM